MRASPPGRVGAHDGSSEAMGRGARSPTRCVAREIQRDVDRVRVIHEPPQHVVVADADGGCLPVAVRAALRRRRGAWPPPFLWLASGGGGPVRYEVTNRTATGPADLPGGVRMSTATLTVTPSLDLERGRIVEMDCRHGTTTI